MIHNDPVSVAGGPPTGKWPSGSRWAHRVGPGDRVCAADDAVVGSSCIGCALFSLPASSRSMAARSVCGSQYHEPVKAPLPHTPVVHDSDVAAGLGTDSRGRARRGRRMASAGTDATSGGSVILCRRRGSGEGPGGGVLPGPVHRHRQLLGADRAATGPQRPGAAALAGLQHGQRQRAVRARLDAGPARWMLGLPGCRARRRAACRGTRPSNRTRSSSPARRTWSR
jgi:hypothetical protein